jgi:hypothetical protein
LDGSARLHYRHNRPEKVSRSFTSSLTVKGALIGDNLCRSRDESPWILSRSFVIISFPTMLIRVFDGGTSLSGYQR